jgi:hypothetical protein
MTERPDRHDHLDEREVRAYTLRLVLATAGKDTDARMFTCGEIEGRIRGCLFCLSVLLSMQAILTVMILENIGALEDTDDELQRWLADLLDGTAP